MWGSYALLSLFVAMSFHFLQLDSSSFLASGTPANQEIDPVHTGSILPRPIDRSNQSESSQPAPSLPGTTIAVRQSGKDANAQRSSKGRQFVSEVPVSKPVFEPNLIGINLGSGHSFSSLAKKYSSLVKAAPLLFSALEPRAHIVEKETGIEARLIAGPIKNAAVAKRLCGKIRLRVNTSCTPTKFTGIALNVN